jgi:hypothetical protein
MSVLNLKVYAGFLFDVQELYDWVNREGLFEAPLSTSADDIARAHFAWCTFDQQLERWLAAAGAPRLVVQGGAFPRAKPGAGAPAPAPFRYFFAAWQTRDPRATFWECAPMAENAHTRTVRDWLEAHGLKTRELVTIPDIFDATNPRTRFTRVAA